MNADSTNNEISIRWNDIINDGILTVNYGQGEQDFQEFDIHYLHPTWLTLGETHEKTVPVGNNKVFYVRLNSNPGVVYEYLKSSNINEDQYSWSINEADIIEHVYKYKMTGDQPGWVSFKTKYMQSDLCSEFIPWDTVNIARKLNPPTISGDTPICSSEVYSISTSDSPTEEYAWTVTNGLKIYQGGQYVTSYTGPETSVTVHKPSGSGSGNVKVKAVADGYADSDESNKPVWYGIPSNNEIDFGVYFESNQYVAPRNESIAIGILNNSNETVQGVNTYNWNFGGTGWPGQAWADYITGYSSGGGHPDNYTVYLYLDNTAPSSQVIQVNAENQCGTDYIMAQGAMFYTEDYGMYMLMSPNPADSYVELTFIEEKDVKEKKNKIKVNKNKNLKNGDIDEYLVQILDKNGRVRKSIESKALNLNIDTRDLEPDTYFLHVNWNNELVKQQLIIR
ncbi:hypothetical protein [Maribellus sediminis]|uniref:hypothetical protein n=1 Tax=Maribellus sediminis TaxID=2696285 RepID=UPI00142FD80C|nr:hypothetical protein [Maribellus sediminis]